MEQITIEKLVHGGQGLGHLADGRAVFVWGALPQETVTVRITRSKKDYAEGIVDSVVTPSNDRVEPQEPEHYMSTSPWQIMSYDVENQHKDLILKETFSKVPMTWEHFESGESRFGYRNKMEYNFWWDEADGLNLALHARGSHQKITLDSSILASDAINHAGKELILFLNSHNVGGRQLKSTILRSQQNGEVACVVYVKDKDLKALPWRDLSMSIVRVYYSNPKSPASVATELLHSTDKQYMVDTLLGKYSFSYAPEGFFQVNVPTYEAALRDMKHLLVDSTQLVDMYSGVGSIGIALDPAGLVSVEVDAFCHDQALHNSRGKHQKFVLSPAEKALDYITQDAVLVVDPPRAGLHEHVRDTIKRVKPTTLLYLSCNPATQARDIEDLLSVGYVPTFAKGYNFFPSTPHIESLIALELPPVTR